jgi:hypothetical protein
MFRMNGWFRRWAMLVAAVTTAVGSLASPAAIPVVAAAPVTALYADGPGFPAYGAPINIGASATWAVTVGQSVMNISVSAAPDFWEFSFASAPGATLTTGTYPNAVRTSFRGTGQNGVDVSRGSTGCSTDTGSFTVLELTTDGQGAVTAAAIDFEIHCESQAPALFGSIRYHSAQPYRGLAIDPSPYPPPLNIGSSVTGTPITNDVHITSTGTEPVAISAVTVTGADFGDVSQNCVPSVAVGASCTIRIRMTPSAVGPAAGHLAIADNAIPPGHGIDLSGVGLAAELSPGSIDFGKVDVDTASPWKTITLRSGTAPVTGISVALTSNDAFELGKSTCGATLAASSTCAIQVRFLPLVAGAYDSHVVITFNLQGTTLSTDLQGDGVVGTQISWGHTRGVASNRWNDGAGLARTTTSTAAYLHEVSTSDLVGSRPVTDSGPFEPIEYSRLSSGSLWGPSFRVNPMTQHGDRPTVAASGAYLYVAWVSITKPVHYSPTAPRILYLRINHANGASTGWSTIHRFTSTTGRVDFPVVAASGSSVFLVWTDSITGDVRLAVSHNRGATWAIHTIGTTTFVTPDGREGSPSVAAFGSRITVSWTGDRYGAVRTRSSTDGAISWTSTVTLATSSNGLTSVAVRGTRSAIAWTAGRDVYVRTVTGSTWGPIVSTTPPGAATFYDGSAYPVVALQGSSGLAVAFSACVSPCPATNARIIDLIWAESTDNGTTWGRQVIGSYLLGAGFQKILPSVVWATSTLRYVMFNGNVTDSPVLFIRAGTGVA